jgi:hypothetical protein
MSEALVWRFADLLGSTIWFVIVWSKLLKHPIAPAPARVAEIAAAIFYNLRPFAPFVIGAQFVATIAAGGAPWAADVFLVFQAVVWWFVIRPDDDDDDRWKRRRRRLTARVRALGSGRLVVEPG